MLWTHAGALYWGNIAYNWGNIAYTEKHGVGEQKYPL
jgi:hypothetical protein